MRDYQSSEAPWLERIPCEWTEAPLFTYFRESKRKNTGMVETNVLSLSYGTIKRRDIDSGMGLLPESFETYQIVDPGNIVMRLTDLQNDQRSLRTGLVTERGIVTSAYLALVPSKRVDYRFGHYLLHALDTMKVYYGLGAGVRQTMKYGDLSGIPLAMPTVTEQASIADYLERETVRVDTLIARKQRFIDLSLEKRAAIITRTVTKGLDPHAEMRDSGIDWLGPVPAHWSIIKLGAVAHVQTGVTLGKDYSDTPTQAWPYLRVANVQDGHIELDDVATINLPSSVASRCRLQYGDVLMTEGGDLDKLGRGGLWSAEVDPCLHQNHVFAVRPDTTRFLSEHLINLMTSDHGRSYFRVTAKRTTNLACTNSSTLRRFPVLLPPIEEQRQLVKYVAAAAGAVDALVEKTRHSIDLLREYRTALISAAVTGQIDIPGTEITEEVA